MKILVMILAPILCLAQENEAGRDPKAGSDASSLPVLPTAKRGTTFRAPDISFGDIPTQIQFTYELGGAAPAPLPLLVTSKASDRRSTSIAFTASVTSSGGNWLTVSQSAGTTPVTLKVSVNPNGLAAGSYSGRVTISSAAASNSQVVVKVMLSVTDTLILQPGAVTFNYQIGGSWPLAKTVVLSSSGNALNFTVSKPSVNWLSVDPTAGTTSASITLSVLQANLGVGTYPTTLTVTAPGAASPQTLSVFFVVRNAPTLIATPPALSFLYEPGFSPPSAQRISISGGNSPFSASVSTSPGGGNWLSIDNTGGATPSAINVSIKPVATLAAGTYTGAVLITSNATLNPQASVTVTLTVAATSQPSISPPSLTFDAQFESAAKQQQTLSLVGTGAGFGFSASAAGSWLSVTPTSGTTIAETNIATGATIEYPVSLTVSVNPAGLAAGTYAGSVTVAPDNGSPPAVIPVTLTIHGNVFRIPQIEDGSHSQTTVILVNTDTQAAPFTMNFYNSDGSALNVPLNQGAAATQGTIPAGGSRTLETQGLSTTLVQGWAEVVAGASIGGTTVFRQQLSATAASEGSIPLDSGTATHFMLPFDNPEGFATQMVFLNSDAVQTTTVSMVFRDESGQPISAEPAQSLSLPPGNRVAMPFSGLANTRGVAEITSATVPLSAFGLRFDPLGAFTSIEPIDLDNPPPVGTIGTIPLISDGGQWQTTMILMNTGAAPAPFSLRFTQPNGAPWSLPVGGADGATEYSDIIPVGGSRVLETDGTAAVLAQGWGQLFTSGSIGGTILFRQQITPNFDSQGAAPLNLDNFRGFVLPFDNTQGFDTWVAVANPDPVQSTSLSVMLTDPNGQVLGNETLSLGPLTQRIFSLPVQFQETGNTQGVAVFSGSNVDLAALGLRFSPLGSFTSVQPLKK